MTNEAGAFLRHLASLPSGKLAAVVLLTLGILILGLVAANGNLSQANPSAQSAAEWQDFAKGSAPPATRLLTVIGAPGISADTAPGGTYPPLPPAVTVGNALPGLVTHYGVSFNGQSMGCGFGNYSSANPEIIAVGPDRYSQWPCGTALRVCGDSGCIIGIRQDACPGCGPNHLDLSESGIGIVCGDQASVCRVSIEQVVPVPGPWLDYG